MIEEYFIKKPKSEKNRRSYKRYETDVPLFLEVKDVGNEIKHYPGSIKDISYLGFSFEVSFLKNSFPEDIFQNNQIHKFIVNLPKKDEKIDLMEIAAKVFWIKKTRKGKLPCYKIGYEFQKIANETKFSLFAQAISTNKRKQRNKILFFSAMAMIVILPTVIIFGAIQNKDLKTKLLDEQSKRKNVQNKLELLYLKKNKFEQTDNNKSKKINAKIARILQDMCFAHDGLD